VTLTMARPHPDRWATTNNPLSGRGTLSGVVRGVGVVGVVAKSSRSNWQMFDHSGSRVLGMSIMVGAIITCISLRASNIPPFAESIAWKFGIYACPYLFMPRRQCYQISLLQVGSAGPAAASYRYLDDMQHQQPVTAPRTILRLSGSLISTGLETLAS
jgi:hypothetical protein